MSLDRSPSTLPWRWPTPTTSKGVPRSRTSWPSGERPGKSRSATSGPSTATRRPSAMSLSVMKRPSAMLTPLASR